MDKTRPFSSMEQLVDPDKVKSALDQVVKANLRDL